MKEVKTYITDDGQQFSSREEALMHESALITEDRIRAFMAQHDDRLNDSIIPIIQAWEKFAATQEFKGWPATKKDAA